MKPFAIVFVLSIIGLNSQFALAQASTQPFAVEQEALYTASIEHRTADIMSALNVTDTAQSNAVHNLIIAQYRLMKARDAYFDAKLEAQGKEDNYANRASLLENDFKPLHDTFVAKLSKILTPEQIELVKDKMTYGKVKVTFDAYVAIIPNLTDADKAKIQESLKAAREEAVDGGSSKEKSEIFQKYKKQINDYLTAHGHDVAKAFKDWEAAHPATTNAAASSSSSPSNAK
jgi:hypothetical protein